MPYFDFMNHYIPLFTSKKIQKIPTKSADVVTFSTLNSKERFIAFCPVYSI